MEAAPSAAFARPATGIDAVRFDAPASAVSWGAILAGAFVAAALALILLLLGTGLGLSAISPWTNEGVTAKTMGIGAIVWMIVVHLSSSAIGGYTAGRLRTKWVDVKTDEVFFRDTAHGLTAWAVGIVLTASFLTSAATAIVGGTVKTGATVAGATAAAGGAAAASQAKGADDDSNAYFVDSLFRSDGSREEGDSSVREEAGRILARGLQQGDLAATDRTYLSQLIAARTGLSQPEADKRVAEAVAQAKAAELKAREAADAARKAAAHLAMWTFLALLIGAFTASYSATVGGAHRDD
jgi:hypothetical protein